MAKQFKSMEKAFGAYGNTLNLLGRAELPLAAKGTLNQLAFESRTQIAKKELKKQFTVRNTLEERSIQFQSVKRSGLDIDKMSSSAGQVAVMKFQRGPKAMKDLRQQELGETVAPRKGSSRLRIPTIKARVGKSANRVVRKAFRPGSGGDWLNLQDIESVFGLGGAKSRVTRIRRAHALMGKYRSRFKDIPYVLPNQYKPGAGVYRNVGRRTEKLHTLTPKRHKLKKRPVVEPGYKRVVRTRADKIWEEQALRRIVRKADRLLKG